MTGKSMDIIQQGRKVIEQEAEAVLALADRIGAEFQQAVEIILACQGRLVVAGTGKSGQISRKISATFASTGTPALYLHPSDALHGDLGMLSRSDVLLFVSNSGETEDILKMLPTVRVLKVPIIAILGRPASAIGRAADIRLDVRVDREAGPMDLAPTSSTTAALAMGDALAMAVLNERDFKLEDFALVHPSGTLGKKLLTTVDSLMHAGDDMPVVPTEMPMTEAILEISQKGLGITAVVNSAGILVGTISDGDLRRGLEKGLDFIRVKAGDMMNSDPKRIVKTELAVRALEIMEDYAITSLFVTEPDDRDRPIGLIHIHDILKTGISR